MKKVFVAGSRKFFAEVERVVNLFQSKGFEVYTAEKSMENKKDTLASERAALLRAFQRIDACSAVYVVALGGYVGNTVALEIAYAFSRGKKIVSSEEVAELSTRALVSKVAAPGKFAMG